MYVHERSFNYAWKPLWFRDLAVFNEALLGRQAWRLLKGGDTLLWRVMKAKYYPNTNFLEAALGPYGSYSWKSIWSSKALVKEGLIWRIGSGVHVDVWSDPWVADEQGRFITGQPVEGVSKVCDLIDSESREWKVDLIQASFNERDAKCILALPLSMREINDELTWAFSKDGLYSVKSAYMLGKGCCLDDFHKAWVDIWRMEAIPKVKHFMWRLCTSTLPVRGLLKHRHLIEQAVCPWCNSVEEPVHHAMFECWRVKDLWEECGCTNLLQFVDEMGMCESLVNWRKCDSKILRVGAYLMWNIWLERNRKVYEDKITPNSIIVERVKRQVEECSKFHSRIYTNPSMKSATSPKQWIKPPIGAIKINADACVSNEGWVGLGVVARDHEGRIIFAATRRSKAYWPPVIAEAKALLLAAKLGRRYGCDNVVLESDCKELFSHLSKGAAYLIDLDFVLGDVLYLSTSFSSLLWSHVCRDGNYVAHHLARLIPFGDEQGWINHVPKDVDPYVTMDNLLSI